jgi:hypothetical protein
MTPDEKLIADMAKEAESLGIDLPKDKAEEQEETTPETPKKEEKVDEEEPKGDEKEDEPESPKSDDEEESEKEESKEKPHKSKVVPYESHRALKQKYNEMKQKLAEATTQKEVDSITDEIEAIAKEANADPKVIQKIVDLARKGKESKVEEGEEPDEEADDEDDTDTQVVIDPKAEAEYFDKEWSEVLPSLKEKYPDASESQLKEAKKLIDKDSHTLANKDKEIDYVVWKNTKALDTLLASPKKRGLEARTPGAIRQEQNGTIKSFDEMSGDDIRKLDASLKEIEMSESSMKLHKR